MVNKDFLPSTPIGRMWHLCEECAEVIQACSKVQRIREDDGLWATNNRKWEESRIGAELHLLNEMEDLTLAMSAIVKDLRASGIS